MGIEQRNCKKATVWPIAKRRRLLGMCGYFTKEEMALRLDLSVDQIVSMVARMGSSYRVTKNTKDYVE